MNFDLYNKSLLSDNTLLKLTVNVINNEVIIVPNMYVTYNNVIRNVLKCLTWSKCLPIWQMESCLFYFTLENKWENNYCERTLYKEIINNKDIQEKIELIRKNSYSLMVQVNKYLKK